MNNFFFKAVKSWSWKGSFKIF